jgi:hypothetical protein
MPAHEHHLPAHLQELYGRMEALAAAADAPADTTGQPRKVRAGTWTMGALCTVLVAMIPVSDLAAVLGVLFGGACFVSWLFMFSADMRIPGARGRDRSEDVIKCYFRAVQAGRWKVAFACLSPMARERKVEAPFIPALRTSPIVLAHTSPGMLEEYWRSIAHAGAHASKGLTRRITRIDMAPLHTQGTIHCYRVGLSIEYYPAWIGPSILLGVLPLLVLWLALRKSYPLTFTVVAYKHRSQWWLLSGELPPMPRTYAHAG